MASNDLQQAARKTDITYDLQIKLEEAATGKVELLRVPRLEMCDACGGTGESWRDENGGCGDCRNEGWINRQKELEVRIPAGIESGTKLRIAGEGEVDPTNLMRGDLYILVDVLKHERFERQGKHLYTSITLTQDQSKGGAQVIVPTLLDGSKQLHIPPGTADGTLFRLGGLGLRSVDNSGRGDLFVKAKAAAVYNTPQNTAWSPPVSPEMPQKTGIHRFASKPAMLVVALSTVLVLISSFIIASLRNPHQGSRNQNVNANVNVQPTPFRASNQSTILTSPTPPARAPFSLPNGSNITPPQGPRGNSYLTINNDTYSDVAVKIVNSSTQKTRRFVYVRANSRAKIKNVAREVCVLRIMSGTDWDTNTRKFLSGRSFYEFDKPFDFGKNPYVVSLQPDLRGTLRDIPINEADFEDK